MTAVDAIAATVEAPVDAAATPVDTCIDSVAACIETMRRNAGGRDPLTRMPQSAA